MLDFPLKEKFFSESGESNREIGESPEDRIVDRSVSNKSKWRKNEWSILATAALWRYGKEKSRGLTGTDLRKTHNQTVFRRFNATSLVTEVTRPYRTVITCEYTKKTLASRNSFESTIAGEKLSSVGPRCSGYVNRECAGVSWDVIVELEDNQRRKTSRGDTTTRRDGTLNCVMVLRTTSVIRGRRRGRKREGGGSALADSPWEIARIASISRGEIREGHVW